MDLSFDLLKPAKYNPRKISDNASAGLEKSIYEFGDISGITWNKKTGNLVTGHQRVNKLKEKGATIKDNRICLNGKEFQIRIVNWHLKKEKAANVAANNPHIAGEFDDGLQDLLNEIKNDDLELFDDLNLNELLKDNNINKLDDDISASFEYKIMIECVNELDQIEKIEKLEKEGYKCKTLIL